MRITDNTIRQVKEMYAEGLQYRASTISPSDFIEKNRVLSKVESPSNAGSFSYDYTPYTRELVNILHPDNPVHTVVVMKSAQVGLTEGLVMNGILYRISEYPCNMCLLSGDEKLSNSIVQLRLDPAIRGTGLEDKIRPIVQKKRNVATGDTLHLKQFYGGFLMTGGLGATDKSQKQNTFEVGFYDDLDSPDSNTKEGGSVYKKTQTRFITLGDRRKAFYLSTPHLKSNSNIYPLYKMGDQRKWHITCLECGELIVLEWRPVVRVDGKACGILFEVQDGDVVKNSVRYRCQSCGGEFGETEKFDAVQNAEKEGGGWIPTRKAVEENFRSYHINILTAPEGQLSWYQLCKEFQQIYPRGSKPYVAALQTFNNDYLGIPWQEQGKSPSSDKFMQSQRAYKAGIVPETICKADGNESIVMLTMACDLNGGYDDARLDWAIVGWAASGASYYIDMGSIGTFQRRRQLSTADAVKIEAFQREEKERVKWTYEMGAENNVWDKLLEICEKDYKVDDGGVPHNTMVCLVDVSNPMKNEDAVDDVVELAAYEFLEWINTESTKCLYKGGKGAADERRFIQDKKRYYLSKDNPFLYMLDTQAIKTRLASKLELKWEDGRPQPKSYINIPARDGDKFTKKGFFDHFSSEHKVKEFKKDKPNENYKYRWVKRTHHVANHFWDVAVYNEVARDIFIGIITKELEIEPTWAAFVYKVMGGGK